MTHSPATFGGRVEGRIALVTGAASGIGRACAERLAQEGAEVLLTDIQTREGTAAAAEICAAGGMASFVEQDVSQESRWVEIADMVKSRHGRLDILVNNAGIGIGGPILEMTLEAWRHQQAINVEGVFLGIKHCAPLMFGAGGSIINMSSVAGLFGAPGLSAYCATKGAVRLLTKAVAMEFATLGVRVNSVHPGIIDTPIWDSIASGVPLPEQGMAGANRPDLAAMSQVATPMGKPGYPPDIAEGVLFLASNESRYMTGAELVIDGGMSAR